MRWSRFLVLGVAGVAAYLAAPDGYPQLAVYVLCSFACVVYAFVGQRRRTANRSAWRFLALGVLAWSLGDLIIGFRMTTHMIVPTVSVVDAAYLFGHVVFVVGVLKLEDDAGQRLFGIEDVLEGLIVATGLGLIAWIFVVGNRTDSVLGAETLAEFWPVVVYTGADGFLLSLVATLLLIKGARTTAFTMTSAAFILFSLSGWVLYVLIDGLGFVDVPVVNAGWLVGYVLLASAALCPHEQTWRVQETSSSPHRIVDRARLAGLSVAILMPPAVMGTQIANGVPVAEWGWLVLGSSVVAVVLVSARMACFLSALRKQSDALSLASITDPVTGLANRRHLGGLLDKSIDSAGPGGVVVVIVDVDRFAQINETFGYPVGDRVLREIGQRLSAASEGQSVVGRLGGDQFVVSMAADLMVISPTEFGDHFRSVVSRTMFVRDINVALDATVGVVESSKLSNVDAESLLQFAHVALTAAKHSHMSSSLYAPSMDCDRHDQMRLLGELETALRERQLRVFFQPCLDLVSGKVSGVEALLRWQHPREGLMSPSSFLPDAERTGLLPAITAYVLEDSLGCCRAMRRTRPEFGVSVNLSVRNLLDSALVEHVANALQRHELPSAAVEFEVTETTAMTDPRRSVDSLVALRDIGVSIAIDDYGTGYSSLAYLRSLPVQTLKIDKSFVTAMDSQPTNASIVRSTIDLARSLGMTVVAEGVEDARTLERLRTLGCDGAQGFHIGKPVPADELDALVDAIENRSDTTSESASPKNWEYASTADVPGGVGSAAKLVGTVETSLRLAARGHVENDVEFQQ